MNSVRPGIAAVIGAILLIAGGCVGIGMLALPMVTGFSGFFPAAFIFLVVAAFMTASALVLAEIDCAFGRGANLITISRSALGRGGSAFTWTFYLFLFISLMVAYVSKGGEITNHLLVSWGITQFPPFLGPLLLALLLLTAIYEGRWVVDIINRILMVGFFVSYLILIEQTFANFSPVHLFYRDERQVFYAIPFLITAFGFHNLIPSLCDYLHRDRRSIVTAIIGGGGLALLIYLVWMLVILGTIPFHGSGGIREGFEAGQVSTELLAAIGNSRVIRVGATYLSVFAIVTSALAQGMGLVDFLIDGFGMAQNRKSRLAFALLVFIPTFFLSKYPALFFLALELAGGIAAVCLFGLIPVAIGWKCRYHQERVKEFFLPGGKGVLALIATFFSLILIYELIRQTLLVAGLLS